MSRLTESDRLKLFAFLERLILGVKIVFILIAIFIILGNMLVLIATWRERSLHQPSKYFIAFLAFGDLLVGLFTIPVDVYILSILIELRFSIPIHFCRFMEWMSIFAVTTSICTLTFISFDRYLKISKPLKYKSRMTTSRSVKIIFSIFLISTAFATYSATQISTTGLVLCINDSDTNKSKVFDLVSSILGFSLPAIIIFIMYTLIFLFAHKRNKMLANGELGETINDQNRRTVLRRDMKVIKMLLVVVGVFLLCWGPSFISTLVFLYHPWPDWHNNSLSDWYRDLIILFIVYALQFVNSLCNPIIYACLDQTYSEAFKHLFRRMMCRGRDSRRQQPPIELQLRA
ncbi:beta-1 adrenergic receptor-like [Dendronephthya gigantea]|uniref:beta-1 adrenergic receptor-like n=1 Tax=Dendronephthya gigantea TaxID=151771 RepID=UPI00106C258A|nr:beta-1 adrenergic receptor-like [Dendronephthya gigantea]